MIVNSEELFEAQREAISDPFLPLELWSPGLERYDEITGLYLGSNWGAHHANQPPRYHLVYGYDTKRMRADLGSSIDPVLHGEVAHDDFQAVLLIQAGLTMRGLDMSPHEISAARFGAITHDYGENTHDDFVGLFGRVVGDMERGTKTPEDKRIETAILAKIHEVVFGGLPGDVRAYGLALARDLPPVADTMAAQLRRLSHEWGDYRTTLWAGQLAMAALEVGDPDAVRTQQLIAIGKQCSPVVRQSLEAASVEYPFLVRMVEGTDRTYRMIQKSL